MAHSCDCRSEIVRVFPLANGRLVSLVLRDTMVPEDPYLNLAREKALTLRTGEVFTSNPITRTIKDNLIKINISI